jgi:hypothetical protein
MAGATAREPRRAPGWGSPSAALLALAAILLAGAGLSCSRKGSGFVCTCTYLTDRDDEYQVKVEVCAKSAEDALGKAKDCAADSPAPIQRCQCIAVEGGECKLGECKKP